MALANLMPFIPRPETERDDGVPLPDRAVVAVGDPRAIRGADGVSLTYNDEGVTVDFGGEEPVDPGRLEHYRAQHDANLAEVLSSSTLNTIATEVLEMIESDETARKPWFELMAKGMALLGMPTERTVDIHQHTQDQTVQPLLLEAIVQFQARAGAELIPPTGPAKALAVGDKTREKEEQASRVADYLNYQLMFEDKPWREETDQSLFLIGFEGCAFKKVYNSGEVNRNVSRLIRAENVLAPYRCTSLHSTPRFTIYCPLTHHDFVRSQQSGVFVRVGEETSLASDTPEAQKDVQEALDKVTGEQDPNLIPEDRQHDVYEMNVMYVVPGFDQQGEEQVEYPYIITIERDPLRVLAIRRGWEEGDPNRERDAYLVKYPFIRGMGFYDFGLLHLIGGLTNATTESVAAMLRNAWFAAAGGGLKTKEGGKLSGDLQLEPGKYKETDATADELEKAFFTPPVREVPMAMFKLVELLMQAGQRLASTTEVAVGDAKNTGPVGTTVALIEQSQKIYSGVHKRLHEAMGEELQILAKLNGRHLPEEGYPYLYRGRARDVFQRDFDARVDVLPVSDPNIFSNTQRIAIAQAELQMAMASPGLYNMREVHRRVLTALRAPDIDAVLLDPSRMERMDPIAENMVVVTGRPIHAYPDQDHNAHNAVHMGYLQMLALQQSPTLKLVQGAMVAHMAEHEAMKLRVTMQQQMGIELPPVNLYAEGGDPVMMQPLSPEIENRISVMAAQIMQRLMAQMQQAAQQQQQREGGQQSEASKDEQAAAEQRRKDAAFVKDQQREDIALRADIERDDAVEGLDPGRVKLAERFLGERGMLPGPVTPRQLSVVSHTLGRDFEQTIRLLMDMAAAGQGLGSSPRATRFTGRSAVG